MNLDDPERYRVAPISTERARFWQRRLGTFVGYFVFGWATVYLLGVLGFPLELRQAAAYLLGLGLLAIGLEVVWRRPFHPVTAAEDEGRRGRTALSVILSACGVLLWLLWVAGLSGVFWLVVVALSCRQSSTSFRPPCSICFARPARRRHRASAAYSRSSWSAVSEPS